MAGARVVLDDPATLDEACDRIKALLPDKPKVVVGFDGMDGVGKSTLADKLAPLLYATVIHLDTHLEKEPNGFVPFIRCQDVTAAMEAAPDRVVIVDGYACVRSRKPVSSVSMSTSISKRSAETAAFGTMGTFASARRPWTTSSGGNERFAWRRR
jgi:ABC-type cobalamin/Fe3+-siderophores transport system ATPase subunit